MHFIDNTSFTLKIVEFIIIQQNKLKNSIVFCVFYILDYYKVAQGACRNENNKYSDIFTSTSVTLAQCQSKCSDMVGCNAVSYQESGGSCYGTSRKASTTSESAWKCYYKGRFYILYIQYWQAIQILKLASNTSNDFLL